MPASNKYEIFFKSITKMTNSITTSLASEKILEYIINETVSILPNADSGLLYLYNEEIGKLIPMAAAGYDPRYLHLSALEPGEGVTGYTYAKGETVIFDYEESKRHIYTLDKHNLSIFNLINLYDHFPVSTIGTPLKYQDKVIGAIILDIYSTDNNFDENAKELLESVADLIAVTIIQAQSISKEKKYLAELEKINQELEKEKSILKKTIEIHNSMNNIALKNKGFEEIISFLSHVISYPIAVYNMFFEKIIATKNYNNKFLPNNIYGYKEIKKVSTKNTIQRIYLAESKEELVLFPIMSSDKLFGIIVIWLPLGENLDDLANLYLDYSSKIFALEWNKLSAVFEADQRSADAFFKNILAQNYDENLIKQSEALGMSINNNFCIFVIKIDPDQIKDLEDNYFINSSVVNNISGIFNFEKFNCIVIMQKNHIIVIAFYNGVKDDLNKKISHISDKLLSIKYSSKIGIGRVYSDFYEIRKSYYEALQCLNILDQYRLPQHVLNYSNLGVIGILLNQDKGKIMPFLKDLLVPLLEYDLKKSSQTLLTLINYCKNNKATKDVGDIMNLHPNTVYIRIKKAERILNLDFDDHQDWLNIQTACLLYEILKPSLEELKTY